MAEVKRLAKINFKSTGKIDLITPSEERLAQKIRSEEILHSLNDEDLKNRLNQERQRIANDLLSDIRHGIRF